VTRAQLRNVLLFAASLGVGVAMSTRDAWSLWFLRYVTPFIVALAVFVWVQRFAAWGQARWGSFRGALRESLPELALAGAIVALVFVTNDWQFKVLSDETNLVATGRSLALDGRFDFPETSRFALGVYHPIDWVFDKRPPLFTFLLALVDALTGFRVKNVWILNGVITGATAFVAAAFLKKRFGRPWNLLAIVWAVANPIVMQTAGAAGVEPTSCLVWAIAGVVLVSVLEDGTAESFDLLIATVFLVGLSRLEAGPLGALLLAGAILASPERDKLLEKLREEWLLWLGPVIAMPVIIQQVRIKDYFQGTHEKPFALAHVLDNVDNWRRVFLDGGRLYPFNAVVTTVEVVAFVVIVALVLARRTALTKAERAAFLLFAAATGAFILLFSAYYWGQPTKATSARFYALPMFFLGLTVVPFVRRFAAIAERPVAVAAVFGLVFAFAFPAAHNRAFPSTINWRKEHLAITDYVFPRLPEKQILLVSHIASQFVIYPMGSITFEAFKTGRAAIERELDRKALDEVLVVQEINVGDRKPSDKTVVDDDVKLQTVFERQTTASSVLRISRLVR
jgi:hypothetical protein